MIRSWKGDWADWRKKDAEERERLAAEVLEAFIFPFPPPIGFLHEKVELLKTPCLTEFNCLVPGYPERKNDDEMLRQIGRREE